MVARKAYKKIKNLFEKYPMTRGMLTYAILWPSGNLLQQYLDGSRSSMDLIEALRYGVYGSCVTAPLLYKWLNVLSKVIPNGGLKYALAKGYLDQLTFAPLNISQFYVGMSLLEGKTWRESLEDWQEKIIPTWMISLSIWPFIQTFNFKMVPEKNRVMVMSLGSFIWMMFLSYMHHTKAEELPSQLRTRPVHYDYKYGPKEALETFVSAHNILTKAPNNIESWSFLFKTAQCQPLKEQDSSKTLTKNVSSTPEGATIIVKTFPSSNKPSEGESKSIAQKSINTNNSIQDTKTSYSSFAKSLAEASNMGKKNVIKTDLVRESAQSLTMTTKSVHQCPNLSSVASVG